MKMRLISHQGIWTAIILTIVLSAGSSSGYSPSDKDKLKPEELIARHLQSLGSPEVLSNARSRIINGTAMVTFRAGGFGKVAGAAKLVSQGEKSLVSLQFKELDYPFERIGFDGNRLTVSQVKPGVRTIIGRYLLTNDYIFKEGLIGGTLSTAWPLLDLSRKNPRLQYDGIKKVDKRQLHQLRYTAGKSSDIKTTIFFDTDTFQHVRTQYQQTLSPAVGANRPGESIGQDETRVNIIEEFADFRLEGGLNLPHSYQLKLEILGPSGSLLYEWAITLAQFTFGEPINATEFKVDVN